jgi:hypothetical protein
MIPHCVSGVVSRYLLDGPEAERLVTIEIERSEVAAVICNETGEELNPSVVERRDYDYAIDALIQKSLT